MKKILRKYRIESVELGYVLPFSMLARENLRLYIFIANLVVLNLDPKSAICV